MAIPTMPVETLLAYRARLVSSLLATTNVVEFEDRRIERRSVNDLLAALGWVDGVLGGLVEGDGRTFKRVRVTTSHKDL